MAISRYTLALFALPAILQGFLHAPAQSLLHGIYAKHAGLALASLGTTLLVVRIFDGAVDPFIGIAADAWRRRTGSYKAFVAAGTIVTALGLWFLFRPPADVGIAYFALWYIVTSLGWSLTEVPYRAWSMQLSSDYVVRTRIQAFIGVGVMLGTFVFFLVPFVGKATGVTPTTEFDLRTLELAAYIVVATLPLSNLVALWCVPDGASMPERADIDFAGLWAAVVRNGPLLYFTGMFLIVGIALGVGQGVAYLFVDGYLGLGKQLAGLLLLAGPVTLVGIPFWNIVCQRLERQKVWAVCLTLAGLSYLGFGFVPPGEAGLRTMVILWATMMFFVTCTFVVAPAMVGDVIDFGRWKFGHDHGGVYIAFYSVVQKSVNALGVGLGFILVDWLGYDTAAPVQSAEGVFAIKMGAAWIPALGLAAMAPFVWLFPLTRARHSQLLVQIDNRHPAGAPA